ncbi:hypothetical protein EDC04DRAFT_2613124 [Pisolithus marmoratus]|nr:hypothetical protein EDC04DRAFT_2613124 [Pisolithus marmoratus]
MVKNKWITHIWKIYQDIKEYQGKSGCHWDNICGAGVQGKFDKQVFENYAKNHPVIWPFKNSGGSASTFPTGAAHHVTDHSPALNGETALDTPDQLGHSLDINEWFHQGAPPAPLSTVGKQVLSEMTGNDDAISTLPFVNASNPWIMPVPAIPAKWPPYQTLW